MMTVRLSSALFSCASYALNVKVTVSVFVTTGAMANVCSAFEFSICGSVSESFSHENTKGLEPTMVLLAIPFRLMLSHVNT
jgi:hypothetical protein